MAQGNVAVPELRAEGTSANRIKFIVGGLLIVGAVLLLAVRSFQSNAVYYMTLSELQAKGTAIIGQDVRLAGELDKTSIRRGNKALKLYFNIVEEDKSLPVVYSFAKDPVPDTFESGEAVVVEGKLGEDGVFYARSLFVQCPSKYEADVTQ